MESVGAAILQDTRLDIISDKCLRAYRCRKGREFSKSSNFAMQFCEKNAVIRRLPIAYLPNAGKKGTEDWKTENPFPFSFLSCANIRFGLLSAHVKAIVAQNPYSINVKTSLVLIFILSDSAFRPFLRCTMQGSPIEQAFFYRATFLSGKNYSLPQNWSICWFLLFFVPQFTVYYSTRARLKQEYWTKLICSCYHARPHLAT